MRDNEIVELFWERSQSAIFEAAKKYGSLCKNIALNILASIQDAEECAYYVPAVNERYIENMPVWDGRFN